MNTMKKLLITTTLLLSGLCLKAQQELFDNDWYLTKVVIDGEEFPTPPSDFHSITGEEIHISYFTEFNETYFYTNGCNEISGDIQNLDENSFDVLGVGTTLMDCMFPLYNAHDGRIYSFFGGGLGENFPWEGFQYEINSNSDGSKTMQIMNPDGNIAFYNNQILSTSEISGLNENNFQLAFYMDELFIKNPQSIAKSISIYNLTGKLVLTSKVSPLQKINTPGLPNGIYIVKILDRNGTVYTKKIRKE